jgi:chromosome segregation ATPase
MDEPVPQRPIPLPGGVSTHAELPAISPPPQAQPQVEDLKKELLRVSGERTELERELDATNKEVQMIETTLGSMDQNTKEAKERIDILEQHELEASDPTEKRKIEAERWTAANWWHEIDNRRWTLHDSLEQSLQNIQSLQKRFNEIRKTEEELSGRIKQVEHEERMRVLSERLRTISTEYQAFAEQVDGLLLEHSRVTANLKEIVENEEHLEEEERAISKKMNTTQSFAEERMLGAARFDLEKKRHEMEESRWRIEDQAKDLGDKVSVATVNLEKTTRLLRGVKAEISKEEKVA